MADGRPPRTGMRVGTSAGYRAGGRGMTRQGTAARGGAVAGGALNSQISVGARPMTMQGLGGMKTGAKGPGRLVQDESFYLGALRTKSQELSAEIGRLRAEVGTKEKEHSQYLTYEKRAEELAEKHKELQGQLGDLNTLADNLNTHTGLEEVRAECAEAKQLNDQEAEEIDGIFTERRRIEQQIKQVEADTEAEKNLAGRLVGEMDRHQRARYEDLKENTERISGDLRKRQAHLDELNSRLERMEAELRQTPVKQKAVALYDQIHALEQKRDRLKAEAEQQQTLSPEAQREKLLEAVKADNQETAGMERRVQEMELQIEELQGKLSNLEDDAEGGQDDAKRQKFLELVRKDKEFDEFLGSYDDNAAAERQRISEAEQAIVELLQKSSRMLERTSVMPSKQEARELQDDLAFKTREMAKSQSTAENLDSERTKLARKLENVQNIEVKVNKETAQLREQIKTMEADLVKFSDLDAVADEMETAKREMHRNKQRLVVRRDALRKMAQDLATRYEKMKAKLAEDETHTQLTNLEKKWQHHEKNNFVMREFISAKQMEADYGTVADQVHGIVKTYNRALRKSLK